MGKGALKPDNLLQNRHEDNGAVKPVVSKLPLIQFCYNLFEEINSGDRMPEL